ncbi:MAG: DUF2306 domain-containing protein [Gemmatimonadaceae bacterium]
MRERLIWVAALVLCLIGITAAVHRALHVADAGARVQAAGVFDALGVRVSAADSARLALTDHRFAQRPSLTRLHVIAGGLFLLLAPLQFWRRLRNSYRRLHRWSGRLLLVLLPISVLASVPFGILDPYAGAPEGVIVTLVALLALGGAGRAYWAIRTQRVELHREWMLRVFALAVGIASVRIVDGVLILLILPFVSSVTIFVLSLWLGWGITLAGVEWWIVRTRRARSL